MGVSAHGCVCLGCGGCLPRGGVSAVEAVGREGVCPEGGVCPGGVCLGVSGQRGVSAEGVSVLGDVYPEGGVCLGRCLPGGSTQRGGVSLECLPGGGGVSAWGCLPWGLLMYHYVCQVYVKKRNRVDWLRLRNDVNKKPWCCQHPLQNSGSESCINSCLIKHYNTFRSLNNSRTYMD